jgi:hypothetical protein
VGNATWTVTGAFAQSSPWNIEGGTLVVNGSLASSPLTTVNGGGTLTGSGTVGNTQVSGGVLQPGSGTAGTSITLRGTLGLDAGSTFVINVGPTTSSFASVTGMATLGGARVDAIFGGNYISKRYMILSAGGISGSFNPQIVTNLPANYAAGLSYDASHAYRDGAY